METGLGLQHLGSQDSTQKYPECRPGLLQTTKAGGRGTGTYPGPVYLLLAQGQDTEALGGDIQADPEGQRIQLIAREQ